ncbi:MAG: hypothetical protein RL518_912 [Pseudomonadota bacterium]
MTTCVLKPIFFEDTLRSLVVGPNACPKGGKPITPSELRELCDCVRHQSWVLLATPIADLCTRAIVTLDIESSYYQPSPAYKEKHEVRAVLPSVLCPLKEAACIIEIVCHTAQPLFEEKLVYERLIADRDQIRELLVSTVDP